MKPKEYLSRYAAAERHIHYLEEQKERWHRRATRVTPQYGPLPAGVREFRSLSRMPLSRRWRPKKR